MLEGRLLQKQKSGFTRVRLKMQGERERKREKERENVTAGRVCRPLRPARKEEEIDVVRAAVNRRRACKSQKAAREVADNPFLLLNLYFFASHKNHKNNSQPGKEREGGCPHSHGGGKQHWRRRGNAAGRAEGVSRGATVCVESAREDNALPPSVERVGPK